MMTRYFSFAVVVSGDLAGSHQQLVRVNGHTAENEKSVNML